MSRLIDIVGTRFGRLVVLSNTRTKNRYGQLFWHCRCDCGKEKSILGCNLRSGTSTSCGCRSIENSQAQLRKIDRHGMLNSNARRSKAREGTDYIASNDPWYKLAAGRWYLAKRTGISTEGFRSVHHFASYCKSIAPPVCPVFGKPLSFQDVAFADWSYSIDRKDPTFGYIPANVHVISNKANLMKRDATPRELVQFAKWILGR